MPKQVGIRIFTVKFWLPMFCYPRGHWAANQHIKVTAENRDKAVEAILGQFSTCLLVIGVAGRVAPPARGGGRLWFAAFNAHKGDYDHQADRPEFENGHLVIFKALSREQAWAYALEIFHGREPIWMEKITTSCQIQPLPSVPSSPLQNPT